MTPLAAIEAAVETSAEGKDAAAAAGALLRLGEAILEHWVDARNEAPTAERYEGFRLLALHRQGARGDPSFNACRETCREIAYHYNLIAGEPDHAETAKRLALMASVVRHLYLFVTGKLQVAGLGEFCCSSRPLHAFGG
jgi:hypothetical protein